MNDVLVVVKIDSPAVLTVGDRLRVFARLESDEIRQVTGLPYLDVPKGLIRVSEPQQEGFYLAERYKNPDTHKRHLTSALQPGILGLLMEKTETVPGSWSAVFDTSHSLNLAISTLVQKGDFVEKV